MIDVDARGRHEAELLREEAARIADTDAALQSVLAGEVVVPLELRRPAQSGPAVARRPGSTRRWIQVLAGIVAAAAVVAVLVVRRSNDPEVVLPADTAVTSSTELVVRPLDPPIRCELETCPSLAVSPEGTLVAFDQAARTLTWYHPEPYTLPVTADFDAARVRLEAIGPDGIAFFLAGTPGTQSSELVAVDASGDEVLGAVSSSGDVEPSVNGLVQRSCWSECERPTRWLMSWTPGGWSEVTHPDVELTSATVTVRLGELRWAIEWPHTLSTRSQVALRWDGGAVLSLVSESAAAPAELIELLPDGSIQHFGLGDEAVHVLLRDGSAVVWRDGQLVRLSPPQPAERPAAWSPELTAHPVEPPIDCERSPLPTCPQLAVSPDGTLVAYDDAAATLTWYDDGEPRVVPITTEFDRAHWFLAVGPHDIAYFVNLRPREIVAVAPSGEEITRVDRRGGLVNSTFDAGASGIVETHCDEGINRCTVGSTWPSPYAELAMPWIDLAGNPITDPRPDPEVTGTDAGIEVSLGAREWLLVGEPWKGRPRPEVFPRSDGGVVMLLDTFDAEDRPWQLLELLPDGTIERYFVDVDHGWSALALPDGSVIVRDLDLQLVRLTPPA